MRPWKTSCGGQSRPNCFKSRRGAPRPAPRPKRRLLEMSAKTRLPHHVPPCQAVALKFLRRGWSVVPIRPGTKQALVKWKPYCQRLPTEEEINKWWGQHPDAQLAVITGPVSRLVVVDVDRDPEEFLKRPDVPVTPTTQTRRGLHLYFACDEDLPTRKLEFGEIRAAGALVLCPPSRHPSGGKYTWLPGRSPDDVPLPPLPRWLRDLAANGHGRRNSTRTPTPPGEPTGGGGGFGEIPSTAGIDAGKLLERIPDDSLRRLIRDGPQPGEYPSRSEAAWFVFCRLVEAGWEDWEILALFLDPANQIARRYAERGCWAARAIQDEIERARRHVAAQTGKKCHVGIPSPAPAAAGRTDSDMENDGEDDWGVEPAVPCGATVRLFRKARRFLGKRLFCKKLTCRRCRREYTDRVRANFRERAHGAGHTIWRYVVPAGKLRTVEDGLARRIRAAGEQHGYVRFIRRGGKLVEVLASVQYRYRGPGLIQPLTIEQAETRLAWLLDNELEDKHQVRFSHTWALTEEREAGWKYLADVTGTGIDVIAEVTRQFFLTIAPDDGTILAWPDKDLANAPDPDFERVVEEWIGVLLALADRLKQVVPAA